MKKLLGILSIVLLGGILSFLIGFFITVYLWHEIALVLLILGGLYFLVLLIVRFHWMYALSAILVMAVGLTTTVFIHSALFWLKGDTVRNVSLDRFLVEQENATVFYFEDGYPLSDFLGYLSVIGSGGQNSVGSDDIYYVAPIVNEEWNIDQPVYFWAGCFVSDTNSFFTLQDCLNEWRNPYFAGLRAVYSSNYQEAVSDSVNSYGLKSHENAVIVEWVQDPKLTIKENLEMGLKLPLWLFSLSLVYTILAFILVRLFGRR